jgi:bifunctional non-homologous end joining protein LigD
MALEEYKRKRDFKKTPEPEPAVPKSRAKQLSYLIQKHDATRLHYDFRLELDGVLLSWAVTKGPSLNPADKRLAVRTEDHPLSYGTFEGIIPKGQYGGGTVMLWDSGTWEPREDPHAGLKKGHLAFVVHGEKLKGAWDLIRMRDEGKRENWLLIKSKDDEARPDGNDDPVQNLTLSVKTGRSMDQIAADVDAEPKRPATKKPAATKSADRPKDLARLTKLAERYPEVQLATLVEAPPQGAEWRHEIKFDGYRLLGFVDSGNVMLRTRNGNDWTAKFRTLTAALESLKVTGAVLDMEAVVLTAEGKSSFQALQAALGEGGNTGAIRAFVFDLLHLNGQDQTQLPLTQRKQALQKLLGKAKDGVLRFSEDIEGQGDEMFAESCRMGLEGIVSKRGDAPYQPGRQRSWLKTKCAHRQEFIIIGYSDARKGQRALGALYLGYYADGKLKYAGKVGTGFTMQSAKSLTRRLEPLAVKQPVLPKSETAGLALGEWQAVHWVKPELLCEVAFTEWTEDGQLRHPSFQGLREDKEAKDVKQETPVPEPTSPDLKSPDLKSQSTPSRKASSPQAGPLVLHGVAISHPDRVISEAGHITKGALAEYYAAVAPLLLPSVSRHPVTLLRCPSGIDGECFYQRNPGKGLGADVHLFEFKHKGKEYEYLYIEDEKGLLEIVQMGAVEIHPWGATVDSIDCPDRLIFDLDPAPDVGFPAVKLAAKELRKRLKAKGLETTLKCTGGKGLHVIVPLAAKDPWSVVKPFAGAVAHEMVDDAPDAFVATMTKAKRGGKIFVDYFRNDYTATAIADYGVRARPGAPVALPLEWKELEGVEAANQFTMQDVLKRLSRKRPSAPVKEQRLPTHASANAKS